MLAWLRGQAVRAPGLKIDEQGKGRAMVRSDPVLPRSQAPRGFLEETDASFTMNLVQLVGGYAAEWRFAGCRPERRLRPWASGDYVNALALASRYWAVPNESEAARLAIYRAERRCEAWLNRKAQWAAVQDLAARLERAGAVDDDEACDVLERHLGLGWLVTGERLWSQQYADSFVP